MNFQTWRPTCFMVDWLLYL